MFFNWFSGSLSWRQSRLWPLRRWNSSRLSEERNRGRAHPATHTSIFFGKWQTSIQKPLKLFSCSVVNWHICFRLQKLGVAKQFLYLPRAITHDEFATTIRVGSSSRNNLGTSIDPYFLTSSQTNWPLTSKEFKLRGWYINDVTSILRLKNPKKNWINFLSCSKTK